MQQVLTVTDANFEADVLRARLPVLLDVWAPWCKPCESLTKALEELEPQLRGRVVVAMANVDQCRSLPRRLGVSVVPTLILFVSGEERERLVGAPTRDELSELSESANAGPESAREHSVQEGQAHEGQP